MQGLRLFPLRRNGFRCFVFEQPGAYLTNPTRKNSRFFTFHFSLSDGVFFQKLLTSHPLSAIIFMFRNGICRLGV